MGEPLDQAAVGAALVEIGEDGGRTGYLAMSRKLAEAGYSTEIIDEAQRVARATRADEALACVRQLGERRRKHASRSRRLRVVGAVAVVMVLVYATTLLVAGSVSSLPNGHITLVWQFGFMKLVAIFGFFVLPAIAAGLIAAAGATKGVARAGLIGLVVGVPVAMLLGWTSASGIVTDQTDGWRQVPDTVLELLLVLTAVVSVTALLGHMAVTLASRPRPGT